VIVLIGFMGAGKTTIGRLVATRLGLPFVDSDAVIEEREGRSVREIFARDGEATFRRIEQSTVLELLGGDEAVLALGGGAVEDPRTRAAVAAATTVHLVVSAEQVRTRVGSDPRRPLLAGADLDDLLERRRPHYDEAATFQVDSDDRPARSVADEVVATLSAAGDGAGPG
jgi:shikimate kinase